MVSSAPKELALFSPPVVVVDVVVDETIFSAASPKVYGSLNVR